MWFGEDIILLLINWVVSGAVERGLEWFGLFRNGPKRKGVERYVEERKGREFLFAI